MSAIGGSLGASPNQIMATGNSLTAEIINQPFAVQNLTYSSASSGTLTVTVGVGRIEWADLQLDQFTSNQTKTLTSADSLGSSTRYVVLVKGTSAGTPTISIDSSAPTVSDTNKLLLAQFTLPSTVSDASNTILVDKRPQITKGGGGGLLSTGDTNISISDSGSNSSIIHTIDGTVAATHTNASFKLTGLFVSSSTVSASSSIASGEAGFAGGTVTISNGVTLTVAGELIIF